MDFRFERLGLRYFVTGSSAPIFYGEPRFTSDVDIVVDLPPSRIEEFCAAFFLSSHPDSALSTLDLNPFGPGFLVAEVFWQEPSD